MFKSLDKWLPGYLRALASRPRRADRPVHLFLAICDHFEPLGPADRLGLDYGRACVRRWQDEYGRLFGQFRDADKRPPQHTFFYPADQYQEELVEGVATLCDQGFGEVEIHLHHRNDTAATLRDLLTNYRDRLRQEHGLLGSRKHSAFNIQLSASPPHPSSLTPHPSAFPAYAFIHGNWALCNSRPDGDWCGVDEELAVLLETGCYADLTMPSAPSATQSRMVNSIYYACDRPGRKRGHDYGRPVQRGGRQEENELLLVQGPLALNWQARKWGMLPRIECADLSAAAKPSAARLDLWLRQHIHVAGKPDWIFVKLHTHGCLPRNADMLLGPTMVGLHAELQARQQLNAFHLHYLTAREMANVIKAAEAGADDWQPEHRDFTFAPPPRHAKP